MEKVKVQVTDDPKGHRHAGREVEEGDVLEVWPHQAEFLEERGIAVPYEKKSKKKSRKRKSESADDESPTEGEDE